MGALTLLCAGLVACASNVGRTSAPMLETPSSGLSPVSAIVPGATIPGPLAMATRDDLALLNDTARYIFHRETAGLEASGPTAGPLPGAMIDAHGNGGGQDGLLSLTPGLAIGDGPFECVAAQEMGPDPQHGGALVSTATVVQGKDRLSMTSRIVLGRDLPHVIITTQVRNEGSRRVELRLGDRLRFGPGAFVSGGGPQTRGRIDTPWVIHEHQAQSYAYTMDGETPLDVTIHSLAEGLDTITALDAMGKRISIEPGATASFQRRFLATGLGTPGSLSWIAELEGRALGRVEARVVGGAGLQEADFAMALRSGDRALGHIPARPGLFIDAPLPPGAYTLETTGPWGLRAENSFSVTAGAATAFDVLLPALGSVDVEIRDQETGNLLAASVVVEHSRGGGLSLGPGAQASRAGPYMHVPGGRGVLKLPHGRYRLTATRGPEFTIETREVEVTSKAASFSAGLSRVLPTPGHLAVALRTYSDRGQYGIAAPDQISLAVLCSGMEFATITDQAGPKSFAEGQLASGTRGFVGALGGLFADPLEPRVGQFTVLSADIRAASAPSRRQTPEDLLASLRLTSSGSPFVSVVWPRGPAGYLELFQFDPSAKTRAGGSTNFDGIEVLSGETFSLPSERAQQVLARNVSDWSAFVGRGLRYTATAASGSARLGHAPVNLPFTWVDVGKGKDDPGASAELVVDALRDNRAVVSTGPFVRFEINSLGPGHLVTPRRRRRAKPNLKAQIDVLAPSWMDIDTVTLFEGTRAVKRWEVEVDPSSRVLRFETAHPLEASADTFFYVQVQGDTPLPTAPHLQVTPFAMTNAIWVDGDRDGQYTPSVP